MISQNPPELAQKARRELAIRILQEFRAHVLPIPDGKIHRFDDPEGSPRNQACWYVLDLFPTAHGAYGNWRTGTKFSYRESSYSQLSGEARKRIRSEIASRKTASEIERKNEQALAAEKARFIWKKAGPSDPSHPYLKTKNLYPGGIRSAARDSLLIPMIDKTGEIVNLQIISSDGKKRFLKGGKVRGCFSLIGDPSVTGKIYVCEGWATGLTLHLETKHAAACAMSCHNLKYVGEIIRRQFSNCEIIIAADDDRLTKGNPGRTAAISTAIELGSKIRFPDWPANAPIELSDFNDLYCWRKDHG